jgi:hypothetical protein
MSWNKSKLSCESITSPFDSFGASLNGPLYDRQSPETKQGSHALKVKNNKTTGLCELHFSSFGVNPSWQRTIFGFYWQSLPSFPPRENKENKN